MSCQLHLLTNKDLVFTEAASSLIPESGCFLNSKKSDLYKDMRQATLRTDYYFDDKWKENFWEFFRTNPDFFATFWEKRLDLLVENPAELYPLVGLLYLAEPKIRGFLDRELKSFSKLSINQRNALLGSLGQIFNPVDYEMLVNKVPPGAMSSRVLAERWARSFATRPLPKEILAKNVFSFLETFRPSLDNETIGLVTSLIGEEELSFYPGMNLETLRSIKLTVDEKIAFLQRSIEQLSEKEYEQLEGWKTVEPFAALFLLQQKKVTVPEVFPLLAKELTSCSNPAAEYWQDLKHFLNTNENLIVPGEQLTYRQYLIQLLTSPDLENSIGITLLPDFFTPDSFSEEEKDKILKVGYGESRGIRKGFHLGALALGQIEEALGNNFIAADHYEWGVQCLWRGGAAEETVAQNMSTLAKVYFVDHLDHYLTKIESQVRSDCQNFYSMIPHLEVFSQGKTSYAAKETIIQNYRFLALLEPGKFAAHWEKLIENIPLADIETLERIILPPTRAGRKLDFFQNRIQETCWQKIIDPALPGEQKEKYERFYTFLWGGCVALPEEVEQKIISTLEKESNAVYIKPNSHLITHNLVSLLAYKGKSPAASRIFNEQLNKTKKDSERALFILAKAKVFLKRRLSKF